MSDEQKIPGVPELADALRKLKNEAAGLMALHESALRRIAGNSNVACFRDRIWEAEAVLERIPKPKKRVLICEFDVTGIEGGLGTAIQSSRNMQSMSARIEERDA